MIRAVGIMSGGGGASRRINSCRSSGVIASISSSVSRTPLTLHSHTNSPEIPQQPLLRPEWGSRSPDCAAERRATSCLRLEGLVSVAQLDGLGYAVRADGLDDFLGTPEV
jgi:hypothetical protein